MSLRRSPSIGQVTHFVPAPVLSAIARVGG